AGPRQPRDANAEPPQRAGEARFDHAAHAERPALAGGAVAELDLLGPDQDAYRRGLLVLLPRGKLQRQRSEFRAPLPGSPLEDRPRAQERGRVERTRGPVELLGLPDLDQAPALDDSDPVGDLEGLLLVVRDEDGRQADLAEAPAKLRPDLHVQRAEGLVQQEDLRLVGQRPRQGDPLLLAARELARVALAEASEADEVEQLLALLLAVAAGDAPDPEPEGDVLRGRHVLGDRVVLENEAEAAPLRPRGGARPAQPVRASPRPP